MSDEEETWPEKDSLQREPVEFSEDSVECESVPVLSFKVCLGRVSSLLSCAWLSSSSSSPSGNSH